MVTGLSLHYRGRLRGGIRVVSLPGCGCSTLEESGFHMLLDEVADEIDLVLEECPTADNWGARGGEATRTGPSGL